MHEIEDRARDARIDSALAFIGEEGSFSFCYRGKTYVLSAEYNSRLLGKELAAIVISEDLGEGKIEPVCKEHIKDPTLSLNPQDLSQWFIRVRYAIDSPDLI